jgi:nicotinamidase-related amidase
MNKQLIVIDAQEDFVRGALRNEEAIAALPVIREAVAFASRNFDRDIIYTKDTHNKDYLETQEGRNLPVEHCIKGTKGWQIRSDIAELLPDWHVYEKPTFGSVALAKDIAEIAANEDIEIEVLGLCTDICVVSNALMLKAYMPEVKISVDPSCCAGVTPESHEAALKTMQMCQIGVL